MNLIQMTVTSLMSKLISIGVDIGTVNGAIAIIDENLKILKVAKAPTYQTIIKSKRNKSKINKDTMRYEKDYRKRTWVDFKALYEIFKPYTKYDIVYTIERITARPGEGEPSSFINGNALGIFQAQHSILNPIAYFEPLAITWKKELGVDSDKNTSIKLTEDIYQVNLRDFQSKGKLDDLAEALLLAFYGLKKYYNY